MSEADAEKYGPSHVQVTRILADIQRIDHDSVRQLMSLHSEHVDEAAEAAFHVAIDHDIEAEIVRSSEDCRREVWNVVWPGSTKQEAWCASWIAARAGLGASMTHLVGEGEYDFEHHLILVGRWHAVFGEDARWAN